MGISEDSWYSKPLNCLRTSVDRGPRAEPWGWPVFKGNERKRIQQKRWRKSGQRGQRDPEAPEAKWET